MGVDHRAGRAARELPGRLWGDGGLVPGSGRAGFPRAGEFAAGAVTGNGRAVHERRMRGSWGLAHSRVPSRDRPLRGGGVMGFLEEEVEAPPWWMERGRFGEPTRLYTPRQVVEQRGTVL